MDDILINRAEQEKFNSIMIQLLLDIKSRQYVLQKYISEQIAKENDWKVAQVFQSIEGDAAKWRVDALRELYGQFGDIHPDILDWLKPKE